MTQKRIDDRSRLRKSNRRSIRKARLFESLEPRMLMNSDWQNPARPLDVNNDRSTSPLDALLVINQLRSDRNHTLPTRNHNLEYFYDVSGDNALSPIDALLVINALNSRDRQTSPSRIEGEAEIAPAGFISIPMKKLAGTSGQIVSITTNLNIGREEFNEMGLFVVDGPDGAVNGVLPSSANYPAAVFQSSQRQVLYSKASSLRTANATVFPAGKQVNVYVLQKASQNGNPTAHLRARDTETGKMQIGWEENPSVVAGWPTVGDRGYDDATVDVLIGVPTNGNATPVINAIPNQSVNELRQLAIQAITMDADANDTLRYSLDIAPSGATIDEATGQFFWTPSEEQGPGNFEVIIRATDRQGAFDTEPFFVTVLEVNRPPVLATINNQQIALGQTLRLSASGSDADVPANGLRYSLSPGAPAGATINSSTGLFVWTPTTIPTAPVAVTINVSDNGSPVLSDSKSFTITVKQQNVSAPTLAASLVEDTGLSNSDQITRKAAVTGSLTDPDGISTFLAGFETTPDADFVNILSALKTDGTFLIDDLLIESINRGKLTDGSHTIRLSAIDGKGNASQFGLSFSLDTLAPGLPSAVLSSASRATTAFNTTDARVSLVGQADSNVLVSVSGTNAKGLASNQGAFQIPSIDLVLGRNDLNVIAEDVAGNSSPSSLLSLTRLPATSEADPVLQWNQSLLNAVRLDASTPLYASRAMAIVSSAVFDAINAIEGKPGYYIALAAPAGSSAEAAVTSAAHRVLSYLYPAQQSSFDSLRTSVLATLPNGQSKTDGVALGQAVADAIIALRSKDGWNDFVDYVPGVQAGDWQPTIPMFDIAQYPQWADLTPFALTDASQFRPAGPPDLNSTAYATALNEVKTLGRSNSTARTAAQTETARFWIDGSGTYTPPGHWNEIASKLATSMGNSLAENARLFAQLNVALADAAIAAWDAKYTFEFWRPVTAIRGADSDNNTATTLDASWAPFVTTPPHPEYVSGHSTFSGAAEVVLAANFGASKSFSSTSQTLPGVTRTFASFREAAEEAGRSRIYGGIHFEFSNQDGLKTGRSVGQQVLDSFTVTTDKLAPKILLETTSGLVSANNATLVGRVIDNISGVQLLEVQTDGGAFAPLARDAQGRFSFTTSFRLDGTNEGVHAIQFRATDFAGNVSSLQEFQMTLDTKAPIITITGPTGTATVVAGDNLTGTASGTGSALVSLTYSVDGEKPIPMATDAGLDFRQLLDVWQLAAGSHQVVVSARDAAGLTASVSRTFTVGAQPNAVVSGINPTSGAIDVGTTFRPQIFFSRKIDKDSLNGNNFYATGPSGQKLPATITPATDGSFAWLFFNSPMPGASTITIHVGNSTNAQSIKTQSGSVLDGDQDGVEGGVLTWSFTTVSLTPLANTTITGIVADPGPDLKPGSIDDVRSGPDSVLGTADDDYLLGIANARVFILGLENQAVTTDSKGRFTLTQVPSGNVKLVIDGQTARNTPAGVYFPEMVMDLQIRAGAVNTVMAAMEPDPTRRQALGELGAYLPRVQLSILKPVSNTDPTDSTMIGIEATAAPNLTPEQRVLLTLEIKRGALIGENGQELSSGKVGISTVPPELVRDMLPPGLLQHTFDITVQAPGISNFATPMPMTFPNVMGSAPGTQLNFLSFDHTTGRLVIEGTATVSADGLSVHTDPGTGITHPGWHGLTPPGSNADGPVPYPTPNPVPKPTPTPPPPSSPPPLPLPDSPTCDIDLSWQGVIDITIQLAQCATDLFIPSDWLKFSLDLLENSSTLLTQLLDLDAKMKNGTSIEVAKQTFNILVTEKEKLVILLNNVRNFSPLNRIRATIECLTGLIAAAADACKKANSKGDGCEQSFGVNLCTIAQETQPFLDLAKALAEEVEGIQQKATIVVVCALFDQIKALFDVPEQGGEGESNRETIIERLADLVDSLSVFRTNRQDAATVTDKLGKSVVDVNSNVSDIYKAALDLQSIAGISRSQSYYAFEVGRQTIRGKTDNKGKVSAFLQANTDFKLRIFDPKTFSLAEFAGTTSDAGRPTHIPSLLYGSVTGRPDADADGLPDDVETVVGTSLSKVDTDADGISDWAEVIQGLDPGGGPLIDGIVAAQELPGEAKEIAVVSDPTDSDKQTAYIATGSHGLAIVDVSKFNKPEVRGLIDLGGDAVDVAVDRSRNIAVVAAGTGGLHFVNISNPTSPTLIRTVAGNPKQVEVLDGIAYVGDGNALKSYDIVSGALLTSVAALGSGEIRGMTHEGATLYTMDANKRVRAFDTLPLTPVEMGVLQLSAGGGKISVDRGIVYAAAINTFSGGYATADFRNPSSPVELSGVDVPNPFAIPGTHIVSNGSGRGILVGANQASGANPAALYVMGTADPTNTYDFITRHLLPAAPFSVALAKGIAFVADGNGDLQIVNYMPLDTGNAAPSVSISGQGADVDPATTGLQVIESSRVPIRVTIADDSQVRSVDVLVNGAVIETLVAAPFDFLVPMPKIADATGPILVQVRATDTGLNSRVSNSLTFQVIADSIAPKIISVSPPSGVTRFANTQEFKVTFSERMAASSLVRGNFTLVPVGGGTPLLANTSTITNRESTVDLIFENIGTGEYDFTIYSQVVADAAGNVVGSGNVRSRIKFAERRDPGSTLDTALDIGDLLDASVYTDELTASDTRDIFKFYLPVASAVEIKATGLNEVVRIGLIRDLETSGTIGQIDNGEEFAATGGRFAISTSQDLLPGTYYVVVENSVGTPYTLSVTPGDEIPLLVPPFVPGKDLADALELQQLTSEITRTDMVMRAVNEVDVYKFELPVARRVEIKAIGQNDDVRIGLIRDLQNPGVYDFGEEFAAAGGISGVRASEDLLPGTYYVRITTQGSTPYSITVTPGELIPLLPPPFVPGKDLADALNLQQLTSEISRTDMVMRAVNEVDVYKFELPVARRVEIKASGQNDDVRIGLIRDLQNPGVYDFGEEFAAAGGSFGVVASEDLLPGTYYVRVTTQGSTPYTLTVTPGVLIPLLPPGEEPGNSFANARNLGVLSSNAIVRSDMIMRGVNESDYFRFTSNQPGPVAFSVSSEGLRIRIFRVSDQQEVGNRFGGNLLEFSLSLDVGDYFILLDNATSTPYQLTVRRT